MAIEHNVKAAPKKKRANKNSAAIKLHNHLYRLYTA